MGCGGGNSTSDASKWINEFADDIGQKVTNYFDVTRRFGSTCPISKQALASIQAELGPLIFSTVTRR
jgi:hypothetical protein